MAFGRLILDDRVKEGVSAAPGTGNFVLSGIALEGYQPFDGAGIRINDNDKFHYLAYSPSTDYWEIGVGEYDAVSHYIARLSVIRSYSSQAGTKINFGTDDLEISLIAPAYAMIQDLPYYFQEVTTSATPNLVGLGYISTNEYVSMVDEEVIAVETTLIVRDTGSTMARTIKQVDVFYCDTTTITKTGTQELVNVGSAGLSACAIDFIFSTNTLGLRVAGVAATTLIWDGYIKIIASSADNGWNSR